MGPGNFVAILQGKYNRRGRWHCKYKPAAENERIARRGCADGQRDSMFVSDIKFVEGDQYRVASRVRLEPPNEFHGAHRRAFKTS
jgi:hypothetical protein